MHRGIDLTQIDLGKHIRLSIIGSEWDKIVWEEWFYNGSTEEFTRHFHNWSMWGGPSVFEE